ncbi:sensor histidine kinase [Kineococcus rubinsiae]|uniref:sensor histidine kinase n=1 Tax=Kineococcus rubinsiae TaxID=2609562 RepID=UPI00142FF238|nr:histidine kinase [Kineococcus rubinsiae]NIZ92187.1 sensor histidine kinase [Kineococcus rubinsiae]
MDTGRVQTGRVGTGRGPGRWRGRWAQTDDVSRVVLYTRTSLPPVFVVVVAAAWVGLWPQVPDSVPDAVVVALLAATLLQTVVTSVVLDRRVRERPLGRRGRVVWAALTLVAVLLCFTTSENVRGPVLGCVLALAVAPLGGWGARRWVPASVLGAVLITAVSDAPAEGARLVVPFLAGFTALFCGAAGTVAVSLWIVDVVRRLARAEEDRARLAVAEERLRFARDLHDVVGRDLAAIAVTSDLVAELARRGRPEAVERAEEVRRIAQDSLREVRAVVRGYRGVDLATELDGSAALLASAGVRCTVEARTDGISPTARTAVAWVVREGVTNVVRHSAATWCRLRVAASDGRVEVLVENDRPVDGSPAGTGSGLAGLAERLRPLAGTVTAGRDGDRFVLRAQLPADATAVPA